MFPSPKAKPIDAWGPQSEYPPEEQPLALAHGLAHHLACRMVLPSYILSTAQEICDTKLYQKKTSATSLESGHRKILTLAVISLSDKLRDFILSWRLEELKRGHWSW